MSLRFTAADRRQQILEVATRLFAMRGYEGTTTRVIAEKAGVTEALIFRHFPSKQELYWAVIECKMNSVAPGKRLRAVLEAGGDDLDLFARLACEILDRRAADQTLSRLLLYSALENHELSHRFFTNYISGYYEVLSGFVRQRIERGTFREVDPLIAARSFLGMVIYHSWVQELFGGKHYQSFNIEEVSRTIATIWLRGMLAETLPGKPAKRNAKKSREPLSHVLVTTS